jgi:hypothetical protein
MLVSTCILNSLYMFAGYERQDEHLQGQRARQNRQTGMPAQAYWCDKCRLKNRKMQVPQTSDGLTPSGPRWYRTATSSFIHFWHHFHIGVCTYYQNTNQIQSRKYKNFSSSKCRLADCSDVRWWLADLVLLRIVWFGCCCCTVTRSCQVLCQTIKSARLSNSRLLHFAASRCMPSDCHSWFLICEVTLWCPVGYVKWWWEDPRMR